MIPNKFNGRCACKTFVPVGAGYVVNRRIVCGPCGVSPLGQARSGVDDFLLEDRGEFEDRGIYGFDDV